MIETWQRKKLREAYQRLHDDGELLPADQLAACYTLFRSRFGPDVLGQLDGEQLLSTMYLHGNKESLVYWLEFKDDADLPDKFGSIAGGSALKFGTFRRKETGVWVTGSSRHQKELNIDEAIAIARRDRDQIVTGADILSAFAGRTKDNDYVQIQQAMNEHAPSVSQTIWGHKYFSLLFPEMLHNFHSEAYQKFQLIKLLQLPPEGKGRYLAGGMFVRLAEQLQWHLNHLSLVLDQLHGRPYRVWRVGTDLGEDRSNTIWPLMRDRECVAIGWPLLGDLSDLDHNQRSKSDLTRRLQQRYGRVENVSTRKAGEVLDFATDMKEGDLVLAASGERILGVGRIAGPYRFDPQTHSEAPHLRSVEWESTDAFSLPTRKEGLRTTVSAIKEPDNLIDVEAHLAAARLRPRPKVTQSGHAMKLEGVIGRVQSILERKGQAVLYGPPGTGKTFWARRAGLELAALTAFGRRFGELSVGDRARVLGDDTQPGLLRMCTFHPAYGYEDFIEGYRPAVEDGGALRFELTAGVFKQLCSDAAREPSNLFILLIDEINRGEIPRIFGELLTLLERDKRGDSVHLSVSGDRFCVPKNVRIIGTMNTADRSIALLDTALRRRFGFVELMPDPSVLRDASVADSIPLGDWLAALNDRIREHIGRDARNLQVGHSYLMQEGQPLTRLDDFTAVLDEDIFPLLEEYCYEDYAALAGILGSSLVDEGKQRIRRELFEPANRDRFVRAVLEPCPELTTSSEIVKEPEEEIGEAEETHNGDHTSA